MMDTLSILTRRERERDMEMEVMEISEDNPNLSEPVKPPICLHADQVNHFENIQMAREILEERADEIEYFLKEREKEKKNEEEKGDKSDPPKLTMEQERKHLDKLLRGARLRDDTKLPPTGDQKLDKERGNSIDLVRIWSPITSDRTAFRILSEPNKNKL